jgi:putative tributyrin esterase
MPLFDCNFFSQTLGLSTSLTVLAPAGPLAGCPVLYLLHGHSDDHTTWMRLTALERYHAGRRLLVVMPDVHRSYYTNMAHGGRFWDFISQEVPQVVQEWFNPSTERSATFAAGLSMGGYGAFKLALTYPECFAAAASLSGALDVAHRELPTPEEQAEWRAIFGEPQNIPGSENDLFALVEKAAKSKPQPRLYQCCGQQDFLYQENIRFRDHTRSLGLDLTYTESPGDHNWDYWDARIQDVLAWLT